MALPMKKSVMKATMKSMRVRESTSTWCTRACCSQQVRTDSEACSSWLRKCGKVLSIGRASSAMCRWTKRQSGLCTTRLTSKRQSGCSATSCGSWRCSGSGTFRCKKQCGLLRKENDTIKRFGRLGSSMSYRRKRAAMGTLRSSPLRSSGLGTLSCVSRRCSGSGTSRCGSRRCSGLCTMDDGKLADDEVEKASKQMADVVEVHTHMDLVSKVMWVVKQQVIKEFDEMTMAEMMGKKGSMVLFAWAYSLAQVLDASPEMVQMRQAKDGCHGVTSMTDFIVNEACGLAFGWSRFLSFMMKKQMVVIADEEEILKEGADLCDPLMHDQLRGGMTNQPEDEALRDWIVCKRTKPNTSAGYSGDVEDAESRKDRKQEEKKSKGGLVTLAGAASGALRGGVNANRFALLAEDEDGEEEPQPKKSFYGKVKFNMEAVKSASVCQSDISDASSYSELADSEEVVNTAALGNADEAPRDSCDQDEEDLRGGALGSSTTQKKKQVAEAVQQMEGILQALQTQPEQQDEADGIIKQMKKMIKAWEEKKPQKEDMKKQIEEMVKKLKSSGDGNSNAATSSAPNQPSRRQSFYAEFHQKAVEKAEERNQQKQKGKGKGKTKGKDGKGKGDTHLPKYDLRQAFPTMSVNSWVSVMKDVEAGKEPSGAVTVCPDMKTAAEIQALSKVHELKTGILLIAKNTNGEDIKLDGSRTTLPPYQGNLALVEAVLGMSAGETPTDCGMTPVKANGLDRKRKKENVVTLRIMVVKGLLSHQDMERMKVEPTYALHLMECDKKLEELRTSGWSEQTEVFVGYIEAEKAESEMLINLSGQGGVFISHLRKDVIEWPNVTWRLPEGNESLQLYHLRILKIARELGKPLAFRRGGGAAFGVVMPAADDDEHIHSWSLSGAPPKWGPVTLREWLEKQEWAVMDTTQPRRRRLPWSFRGRMAGKPNERSFSNEVEGDDGKNFYVLVKRWEKRRQPEESHPIAGAGQRWWHKSATFDPIEDDLTATWPDGEVEEPQPTLLDATVEDAEGDDNMNGNKREKGEEKSANGTSPPKKKVKQAGQKPVKPDLDRIAGGMQGPDAGSRMEILILCIGWVELCSFG